MISKEIQEKEKLYCELMRKAYKIALKDREASNQLNYEALKLKEEIKALRKDIGA
jgi:Arc/MetJ family transcription regulator